MSTRIFGGVAGVVVRAALTSAVTIWAVAGAANPARAGDFEWSGLSVATNDWGDFGNWFGFFQTPPTHDSLTRIIFQTANPAARHSPNLERNYAIGELEFDSDPVLLTDPEFTLQSHNGSTLTIGIGGIENWTNTPQTINHNVSMSASHTWRGPLAINGNRGGGGHALTITVGLGSTTNVRLFGNGSGHTGPIFINVGQLVIGHNSAISTSTTVTMNNGSASTLAVNPGIQASIGGLSGNGTLNLGSSSSLSVGHNHFSTSFSGRMLGFASTFFEKIGGGTLTLNGNSSSIDFKTPIGVVEGTLRIGSNNAITTANSVGISSVAQLRVAHSIAATAGRLFGNGALVLDTSSSLSVGHLNTNTTFSGQIFGNSSTTFEKAGAAFLTLTGDNSTFAGAVRVVNGTLEVGSNTAVGSGPITMNGGGIRAAGTQRVLANTLNIGGSFTLGRLTDFTGPINLNNSATIFIDNFDATANSFSDLAAILGGTHSLTIQDGPLHGSGTGGIRFTGHNTYTGGTAVNSGRLVVASTGSLASTGAVNVTGGGELILENTAQTISHLFVNAGHISLSPTLLTIDQTTASVVNGTISGSGGIIKSGDGPLSLLLANTYTGGTTIDAGELFVHNSTGSATGTGPVTVNSSGTLAGTGSVSGTTTVHSGGFIAPGGASSVGTLGLEEAVFEFGSTLAIELTGSAGAGLSGGHDQLAVTGNASLAGTLDAMTLDGYTPNFGEVFHVLSAATRTGTFDRINGVLPEGEDFALAPIYDHEGNTGVTLVTALPGDADLNGAVALGDLGVFLENIGDQGDWSNGDFTGDGVVALGDLGVFLENVGRTMPIAAVTPAAANVVPEPSSLLLAAAGLMGLSRRRVVRSQ